MLIPIIILVPLALTGAIPVGKHTEKLQGPIVDVGYSTFQGNTLNGIYEWLGVRYAQPPTKELRFKAPQEPKDTKDPQQANKWGAFCLPTPSTGKTAGADEDCLFLNIWAPQDRSKLRPVYFYIQGGGLNNNASPHMNGTNLIAAAEGDMVVVTLNYRVGVFGFLASKEVKAGGNLNVGNLDQRFALQWVQKHISKFGGDPERVTIGGASAGAASVNLHLMAYGGRDDGLFHAAVGHSNSFGMQLTVDESQYQYDALIKRAKCDQAKNAGATVDSFKCLQELSIDDLVKINLQGPHPGETQAPLFMYSNVVDGDFTMDYTYKAFQDGKFIKVPTIFGSDTNEGTIFTPSGINSAAEMNTFLKANYIKLTPEHLAKIDGYYPKAEQFPNKGSFWRTTANAYGEMRYNCPGLFLSQVVAATSNSSWHYHWDVLKPENAGSGIGVPHCADVDSIWGTTANAADKDQIPVMSKYYASFIRTHDPNTLKEKDAPVWEKFSASNGQKKIHFKNGVKNNKVEDTPKEFLDKCAWFASVGPTLKM
ncbi:Alpha/Beta hydrolase protein [Bisporella sp. PMI_857]|nr:Alpha/Beta hydrolase protein [Bisporella sp. PMI_857]